MTRGSEFSEEVREPAADPMRPQHVVGWLIAGFWVLHGCTIVGLIWSSANGLWVVNTILGLHAALGIFFLTVGVRYAHRNPRQPFAPRTSHTVLMGVMSAFFVLYGIRILWDPALESDISTVVCVSLCLFGAAAIPVIAARLRRSPLAEPATAALNIIWALFFPFGTALFLWWLLSVRKQEGYAAADSEGS